MIISEWTIKHGRSVALVILTVSLSACAGKTMQQEMTWQNDLVREQLAQQRATANQEPEVVLVSAPTYDLESMPINPQPLWLSQAYWVKSQGLPFYVLVDDLSRQHGVVVRYGAMVDLHKPVHLVYTNGTVAGALRALAAETGYAYRLHAGELIWSRFKTRRFDLSYVGGMYDFQIGGKSDQGDEDMSVLGSRTAEFQSVTTPRGSVFDEVVGSVKALVGQDGHVLLSEATSSLSVSTTPAKMIAVEDYIAHLNRSLSRQVELHIQVLKFRHASHAESGIDWDLVRQSTSATLSFDAGIAGVDLSNVASSSTPAVFSSTSTSGQWSNSRLLIAALQLQGSVSVVTEPRILTLVNRVTELKMAELQSYISESSVTVDASGNVSTSMEASTVLDGYTIYTLTNVDDVGQIYLHLSSKLSDLLEMERITMGNTMIESPNIHENHFSQTLVLRPGETVVANSLKQVISSSNAKSPVDSESLATFAAGQQVIEETLVLITPTILHRPSSW